MRRFFSPAVALLVLLSAIPAAAADRAPYSPEQLSLIRNTAECKISPDGKTVAFTTTITGEMELWVVSAAGGWPSQLTNLHEYVSDISWSPDGKWLVFASDYGGNARPDLFRVPAVGGQVEKLTKTRLAHNEPRYSPDGKRLAFIADPDREFIFQLHVLDLGTRKITRLTREAEKVQTLAWAPDGKTIAINRSGDEQKGDLLLVDAATGAVAVVKPQIQGGIVVPERFSPDGKTLLVTTRNKLGFMQMGLLELKPSGTAGKPPQPAGPLTLFGPGDWDVAWARWNKNGIYYCRNEGGARGLYHVASPRAEARPLLPVEGIVRQLSFDKSGVTMAMLREEVSRPADVWIRRPAQTRASVREAVSDGWEQLTFSLMGGVNAAELARGEMAAYKSFDGQRIHALVLKPPVRRLGSPPPAVVFVHGGPNGQVSMAFRTIFHVLTEAGFVVIAPNYRGSTGYGKAFEDANNLDWGGKDLKDIAAAVKHFAARGTIDARRVGITGGSYGGYMTLMALCRTPEIWKAGVELYGMPDLVMDYYLAKSRFEDWYHTEMGNPKTNAALYRERSPLLYLDEIKAPLLVFQGVHDTSVPRAESDLLVAVLRELKKDYQYILYEDEGHGFTRRKNLLDYYKRTTAFFVKQLGQPRGSANRR
jgi:dipeptidyl aminopeptidase/acylaminoacyl peptidase